MGDHCAPGTSSLWSHSMALQALSHGSCVFVCVTALQTAGAQADTYIVINATCVELTNVREYINKQAPDGQS